METAAHPFLAEAGPRRKGSGFAAFRQVGPPPWLADHTRVKQRVLMPIGSRGHVPLIRLAASLNIDTQDRQDKQDETLLHKKLTGSIIECAFVENRSVLHGPSRIPFESFPTPWNPFADSSFALLTDLLSPLVEIFSPFPTFGGSLLSFLQPLSGPSSFLVALRGFLFLPLWIILNGFRDQDTIRASFLRVPISGMVISTVSPSRRAAASV